MVTVAVHFFKCIPFVCRLKDFIINIAVVSTAYCNKKLLVKVVDFDFFVLLLSWEDKLCNYIV